MPVFFWCRLEVAQEPQQQRLNKPRHVGVPASPPTYGNLQSTAQLLITVYNGAKQFSRFFGVVHSGMRFVVIPLDAGSRDGSG